MMSASGKSSNRLYEYNRGYSGGGHGIYAAEGDRDYRRRQGRLHRAGQPHNKRRCDECRAGR